MHPSKKENKKHTHRNSKRNTVISGMYMPRQCFLLLMDRARIRTPASRAADKVVQLSLPGPISLKGGSPVKQEGWLYCLVTFVAPPAVLLGFSLQLHYRGVSSNIFHPQSRPPMGPPPLQCFRLPSSLLPQADAVGTQ